MISKFISYGSAQIISALSLFCLVIIQTNNLTLYDYGLVALIQLFSEVIKTIAVQWNAIGLVRFFPDEEEKSEGKIFSYVFSLSAILLIILSPILYFLILYQVETSEFIYFTCVIYILLKSLSLLFLELHRIADNKKQYFLATAIGNGGGVVLTYLFTKDNPTFEFAIIAMALGQFLQIVIAAYKVHVGFNLDYIRKVTAGYSKYTMPLIVSGILTLCAVRFDRFFIATFLSLEEFAAYSAIANLVYGLMAIVFSVTVTVYYPELIRNVQERSRLLYHQVLYIKIVLFSGLTLSALLISNEPYVIPLMLGSEYSIEGQGVFAILVSCALMYNLNEHVLKHPFHFSKKTNYLNAGLIIGLLCNLILVSTLATFWGLIGVVVSVVSSQSIVAVYYISKAKVVRFPVPYPKQAYLFVTFSVLLFYLVKGGMSIMSQHSILSIVFVNISCLLSYFVFLYFVNFLDLRTAIRRKL